MLKHAIKFASNIPGWRTNRKIVVIESDDWGSIRMPSLDVYHKLKKLGVNVQSGDNDRFNTLDTLASADDLDYLFTTLRKFKDNKGNHPVITAMALSANPDFEKIALEKYEKYSFEPVTTTLEKYGKLDAWPMWKQGEEEKLFYPEFHGREHLNVKVWMDDLQRSDKHALEACKRRFWGFRNSNVSGVSYQSAFDLDFRDTIAIQQGVIQSGLQLFEKLHGRKAAYFVPPNGAIHQKIIDVAVAHGINYVSSSKIHREPQGEGKIKKRYRYIGKKGVGNMIYLTRNCFFEQSYKGNGFSIADCLGHVQTAFMFRKPAVISTHRVNYIGGLNQQNRVEGNNALELLLSTILKRWPDVEFMTSVQLGDTIRNDKK